MQYAIFFNVLHPYPGAYALARERGQKIAWPCYTVLTGAHEAQMAWREAMASGVTAVKRTIHPAVHPEGGATTLP